MSKSKQDQLSEYLYTYEKCKMSWDIDLKDGSIIIMNSLDSKKLTISLNLALNILSRILIDLYKETK